jgi:nitrogen regulatory protein P-II 1
MKKIEAIIRPERLEAVVEKLDNLGYAGITIIDIEGHGRQKGIIELFRGKEYKLMFLPKVKLELVIKDDQLEKAIDAITSSAYTGEVGDGKIFVSDIIDVIRVRTKERGETAI